MNVSDIFPSGNLIWRNYSTSQDARNGTGFIMDTSSGALTLTLPAVPVEGYKVGVMDLASTFGTNNLTVARNGQLIKGQAQDLVLDTNGATVILVYSNSTNGWLVESETPLDATSFTYAARKNLIINGNFAIWQRNTSSSGVAYDADDRWYHGVYATGSVVTRTAFTPGQTDVPGEPQYFSKVYFTPFVGSASAYVSKIQRVEDVRTLAGQTATLSFYAKSSAANEMSVEFVQNFGSGGSTAVQEIGVTKLSLTTSWQKFTITVDIPSISGKTVGTSSYLAVVLWFDAGSNFDARTDSLGHGAGVSTDYDIAQVQLEKGNTATDFEYRTYGQELELCQRYYQFGNSAAGNLLLYSGNVTSAVSYHAEVFFTQTMRAVPTVVEAWFAGSNFPTTGAIDNIIAGISGFRAYDTSNGTGAGYYMYTWTADAEL